jgi:hypothetical protein
MNTAPTPAKTDVFDYLDERGCPDLQKLVEAFGGYNKITPET